MRSTEKKAPAVLEHSRGQHEAATLERRQSVKVMGMTAGSLSNAPQPVEQQPRTKAMRILAYLANGGSLNRFEAQDLGDSCLNTTISKFRREYRLIFTQTREDVPGRFGMTRVTRYRLSPAQRRIAQRLIATKPQDSRGTTE